MQSSSEGSSVNQNDLFIVIHQKEVELNTRLLAARLEAENMVKQAEKQAQEIIQAAHEQGKQEAEAHFSSEVTKATIQTEKEMARTRAEAARLARRGKARMDKAVDYIVRVVLGEEVE